jgi:hypothetical protein
MVLVAMAGAGLVATGLLLVMRQEQIDAVSKASRSITAHAVDNPGHAINAAATANLVSALEKLASFVHVGPEELARCEEAEQLRHFSQALERAGRAHQVLSNREALLVQDGHEYPACALFRGGRCTCDR